MTVELMHAAGQLMVFTLTYSCLSRNSDNMTQFAGVVNAVRLHGKAQIIVAASPAGSGQQALDLIRRTFREVTLSGETFVVSNDPSDWFNFVVTIERVTEPVAP